MSNTDARPRHDVADVLSHPIDRLDPVVNEENLAAAVQLARNAFVDQPVVPRLDVGENGRAVARRCLHQRHVAQTGEREMQGSRYRCSRESEHVGIEAEALQSFLVFDTEAMFFVNDDQSQLRECDVGAEQPVSPDHDIDLSRFEILQNFNLLLRCLEPAHRAHVHGKVRQSLAEGACVSVGQEGRIISKTLRAARWPHQRAVHTRLDLFEMMVRPCDA